MLRLIHPILGVCREEVSKSKNAVINRWKSFYGEKFYDCKVEEVISESDKKKTSSRPVIHKIDGERYSSVTKACIETGVPYTTIIKHCNKERDDKFNNKFKWA